MAADTEDLKGPARVLILSDEAPQDGTAGGLLLHRLFAGYPADRLHVLTHHVPTMGAPLPGVAYRRLMLPWQRFEKSRFNRLKRSMRAFGLVPPVSSLRVDRMLGGFEPELVFCVMQHAVYYDAAHRFARRRRLPLVTAIHDVNEEFERVYPWALGATRRRDGAFYRYASRRLCVSPEMERLCSGMYGAPGSVLYPNRDEALLARPIGLCAQLRRPPALTLGFAGNLNFGYGEGILQMLPALRAEGVRLVIYGRPPAGAAAPLLDAADCCELRGFVPTAEAWDGLKRDCDAVWLPYPDLGGQMERLYRHHFPSKLPEYLALGMPVVVSGPAYATGMRWARQNLGPELCARNLADLMDIFQRLAADPSTRRKLAERCLEAGRRDFDPRKISEEFHAHLAAAASEGPPSK
jgi:glycosyltransferase involved in cell wall biosynthesis